MGDSANDIGLFKYPFETEKQLIKVFLGDDEKHVGEVFDPRQNEQFFFLKGTFVEGAKRALSYLLAP
jgi:hypothetical protein